MTFTIAIPDSAVSDCSDIRAKTEKIFQFARISAIYQVPDIMIYHDPFLKPEEAHRESRRIRRILEYIECPQYLRKRLFPISRDTSAVGVLSPLATPHHVLSKEIKPNEIREAVIFLLQGRTVGDVGSLHLLEVINPPKFSLQEKVLRVTVKIILKDDKLKLRLLPNRPSDIYWGYKVHVSKVALSKALLNFKGIKIATSKTCEPITSLNPNDLQNKDILITFGSPYKGIPEMLKAEGKKIRDVFDHCINSLTHSGTRSLRLEEAMMITLSKLDLIIK
ncbi:putative RNA uridine N3 methyltransferase [Candidatus Hodarchaeum mangrovi]